jgi:hypothetical protein
MGTQARRPRAIRGPPQWSGLYLTESLLVGPSENAELREMDEMLSDFKTKHRGELPSKLGAILLSRTQLEREFGFDVLGEVARIG